jgi:MFS family permease
MQQLAELEGQADRVEVRSSRKRKTSARRKVTVRLSEGVCGRLDVATDRPGVGKSMLVEAALEHFMNPAPSLETLLRERLDDMHTRFDHLERDMRMIAETVALHARYQLAVTPLLSEERQQEAVRLGGERFRVMAQQVDRRVRQRRPLMQETIDTLRSQSQGRVEHETGEEAPQTSEPQQHGPKADSECFDVAQGLNSGEGGSRSRGDRDHGESPPHARRDSRQNSRPIPPNSNPNPRDESGVPRKAPFSTWRIVLSVFLPFAAGYYLAYLFRTINAAISPALASEFGLDAAEAGLLASVYFLVFGLAQIPIGVLLDRLGPRRVQGVLLVIAAGGATLFGNASSFPELLVARAMIGLGVAGSLMAGLKSIVTWFPRERVALANGWMIMLGSLGAVTATAPADWLLNYVGWRSLFEVLTIGTFAVSGIIYMVVPERVVDPQIAAATRKPLTLWSVYSDPRFLRVAPLSATCIGSAWALQSLWGSAWLTDVEGLDGQSRVTHMLFMAVGLSLGALLLGAAADRLRKLQYQDRSHFGWRRSAVHGGRARPGHARSSAIASALVSRVHGRRRNCPKLCDRSRLFPKGICRAEQWRLEPLALRLGVHDSIRHWVRGRAMAVSGGTLSSRGLSDRIRSQPCISGGRTGVVRDAMHSDGGQECIRRAPWKPLWIRWLFC